MSELNELPPLMVGRGSDREDVHPAWRVWRRGQSKSVLLRPGETENELTRAYDAIVAEKSRTMSGNQPEKGAEAVTGVAPQKCRHCGGRKEEHIYGMKGGRHEWDEAERTIEPAPAPQPWKEPAKDKHGRCVVCGLKDYHQSPCNPPHSTDPAPQPMSAEAWLAKYVNSYRTDGYVVKWEDMAEDAMFYGFSIPELLEAYAVHQYAALIAERDHLNESAKRLFSDNLALQQRAEAAEDDLREAIGKEDQIRTLMEPFTNERANHVDMVRDALRRLQGGEPYETCPRCEGHCQIYDYDAMAPAAEDFSRSFDQDAYVIACPACQGSGRVPKLPAPPTAEPCECTHLKARHNFKAVGECMDCGCTGYVAAEPAKEGK